MNLQDVKDVLTATYLGPLTLPDLAKRFGVHPVYLSKSFKKVFGFTITAYYRQCRIEAACQLLNDAQLSLVEVALECGFYDQSHFCKYFQSLVWNDAHGLPEKPFAAIAHTAILAIKLASEQHFGS